MTRLRLNPFRWPLRVKAPILVAALTILVSTIISETMLSRLARNQEVQLERLAGAYLDGLSNAVLPHLARHDIWAAFDVLDRANQQYKGVKARYTIVALTDGRILAASVPAAFPVETPVPKALAARFGDGDAVIFDEDRALAWVRRTITADGLPLGTIYAELNIAEQIAERRRVLLMLVILNSGLTIIFAAIGYLAVRRMLQPVSVLGAHIEQVRGGDVAPIPNEQILREGPEFATLFRRFNAMVAAINERKVLAKRLAEEEGLAQLGKLASSMAHEVNNPLGGMMTAVSTLRKHGTDPQVRRTALGLLERGLDDIRNVVRATLVTYKGVSDPSRLRREDFDDLRFLIQHKIAHRCLRLDWRNALPAEVDIDGAAIRHAALNLLLNACNASPQNGAIRVLAEVQAGTFRFTVADQGPGLPPSVEALFRASERDDVPAPENAGLGAWIAARLVARMGGRIGVETAPGAGTRLTIAVPLRSESKLHAVA